MRTDHRFDNETSNKMLQLRVGKAKQKHKWNYPEIKEAFKTENIKEKKINIQN